jgi:hypothetical protein
VSDVEAVQRGGAEERPEAVVGSVNVLFVCASVFYFLEKLTDV